MREGEVVLKIVKRHYTPLLFSKIKAVIALAPLYFVVYIISISFGVEPMIIAISVLTFIASIGLTIALLDYILDKLVITNKRVIYVDWKSLLKVQEAELELRDIQNILTKQLGVLRKLKFFNYGTLEIESAASRTSILVLHCSDPDGAKHVMLSQLKTLQHTNTEELA